MDLSDVTKDLSNQTNYRISQRLEKLMNHSVNFRNLDESNKKIILDLIKKYKEKIRQGINPSASTIREEKYYLYENRIKLGLTHIDLEQINKLLDSFNS